MVRGTDGHACLFFKRGAGGVYIYLHVQQSTDGLMGILKGFTARRVKTIVVVLVFEHYRSGLGTV